MKNGDLAFYDSFVGLVPCKIIHTQSDFTSVRFTATRKCYKQNEILLLPTRHIVLRTQVHHRHGITFIRQIPTAA